MKSIYIVNSLSPETHVAVACIDIYVLEPRSIYFYNRLIVCWNLFFLSRTKIRLQQPHYHCVIQQDLREQTELELVETDCEKQVQPTVTLVTQVWPNVNQAKLTSLTYVNLTMLVSSHSTFAIQWWLLSLQQGHLVTCTSHAILCRSFSPLHPSISKCRFGRMLHNSTNHWLEVCV